MKRGLFIIFLLVLMPIAPAIDMEIDDDKTICYPNGQIKTEIEIEVSETEDAYTFNCRKIEAYDNKDENNTADFTCYVKGKKKSSLEIESGTKETITLVSAEKKFNESKNYKIRITIDSKREYAQQACPGYQFSCEGLKLHVNCVKKENRFEAVISGMPELSADANILEYFEVMPNYKIYYGTPTWTTGGTYRVERYDNKYLLKVYPPVVEESLAVRMTKCPEEMYNSFDYATCKSSFSCKTDEDCLKGQICQAGECKELVCSPCEYLEGSECKPKRCNDNNPCTTDSCNPKTGECVYERISEDCCATDISCEDGLACTENKCINQECITTEKICPESEDPCKIFVCIEPDGCIEKPKGLFCRIKLFFKNLFSKS
jgi:hypothetical protein